MKKKDELPVCREQDLIMDLLVELTSKGCGCLLVINDDYHLLGTFTDGDLRRTLKASGEGIFKLTVGEMCNRCVFSSCCTQFPYFWLMIVCAWVAEFGSKASSLGKWQTQSAFWESIYVHWFKFPIVSMQLSEDSFKLGQLLTSTYSRTQHRFSSLDEADGPF